MKSDSYYRDLLADVVGDVWPAPHSTAVKAAHAALVGEHPQVEAELSAEAARVVTHVRAPTDVGKFATGLRGMSEASWRSALEKLRAAGHRTERMPGTVADDPTVTGGSYCANRGSGPLRRRELGRNFARPTAGGFMNTASRTVSSRGEQLSATTRWGWSCERHDRPPRDRRPRHDAGSVRLRRRACGAGHRSPGAARQGPEEGSEGREVGHGASWRRCACGAPRRDASCSGASTGR